VARELSKARLCKQLGPFQPASERQFEAARQAPLRYSPMPIRAPQSLWKEYEQSLDHARTQRQEAWGTYRRAAARERQQLNQKYRRRRGVIATLPVSRRELEVAGPGHAWKIGGQEPRRPRPVASTSNVAGELTKAPVACRCTLAPNYHGRPAKRSTARRASVARGGLQHSAP
jgi:hypothetical protein